MTLSPAAALVFTTSSPESRPSWCDSVGTWRVSHRDALDELLRGITSGAYTDTNCATPSGRLQLFAGIRDNRNPEDHSRRCEELLSGLRAAGLKARVMRHGGRVAGVIVTDRGE